MRKILVLCGLAILFSSIISAEEVDLQVEENPSLTAGRSGTAVLNFNYEGDQFSDKDFDPFAMILTFDHEEGNLSNSYLDASGHLNYLWAGNDYSFKLECVSNPEEISSRNQTGSFYSTQSQVINSSQILCVPKNTLSVLKSNTFIEDGTIELELSTDPVVAPGEMDIKYGFGSFTGFPEFDPLLEADENGTVELEEKGIRIEEIGSGTQIVVVVYSTLNVETEKPLGQQRELSYYGLDPEKETSGRVKLEEKVDTSEWEKPRLYRCEIVEGDCEWQLIPDQSYKNNSIVADLSTFSLFGVFTSRKQEVVTETVTETTGGGGSTTIPTEIQQNDIDTNSTTSEVAQRPTASFDIIYTSPRDVRFNASNSYDPDGTIESYEWSFGQTGVAPEVSLLQNQSNVTLTVTDSQGLQDSITRAVNISVGANRESAQQRSDNESASQSVTGQFSGSTSSYRSVIGLSVVLLISMIAYITREEILHHFRSLSDQLF